MVVAEPLEFDKVPWEELDRFPDRSVFQTRGWLEYLRESQHATPVVLALTQRGTIGGYFTGATVRKFGVCMLGSPLPGWNTPCMGFNLTPAVTPLEALAAVERYAFRRLGCRHLEVCDPSFSLADGLCLDFRPGTYLTYSTDLTRTEDELFSRMDSACRRCIRKAERELVVEHAEAANFAEEYFEQLREVIAKQGIQPTYGINRVRSLIRHMLPTGNLLLLRARNSEGLGIGTGIYPGFGAGALFWGNASWRAWQQLRPNEALHWYAMRYWKSRGVRVFDWGGRSAAGGRSVYKEKFGVEKLDIPRFMQSHPRMLGTLRTYAVGLYHWRLRITERIRVGAHPRAAHSG